MTNSTRRDALKALAAATGAVTVASLPTKWARPAVRVGAVPVHAQVSCPGSVTITLLDEGDAHVSLWQGPLPDSQSGGNVAYTQFADHAVDAGYSATWNCQNSCLQLNFSNYAEAEGVAWEIDIAGVGTVPVNVAANGSDGVILINLSTGAYSLNYGEPVAGCPDWAQD